MLWALFQIAVVLLALPIVLAAAGWLLTAFVEILALCGRDWRAYKERLAAASRKQRAEEAFGVFFLLGILAAGAWGAWERCLR